MLCNAKNSSKSTQKKKRNGQKSVCYVPNEISSLNQHSGSLKSKAASLKLTNPKEALISLIF